MLVGLDKVRHFRQLGGCQRYVLHVEGEVPPVVVELVGDVELQEVSQVIDEVLERGDGPVVVRRTIFCDQVLYQVLLLRRGTCCT